MILDLYKRWVIFSTIKYLEGFVLMIFVIFAMVVGIMIIFEKKRKIGSKICELIFYIFLGVVFYMIGAWCGERIEKEIKPEIRTYILRENKGFEGKLGKDEIKKWNKLKEMSLK
jgi:predicted Co/Zn/Cd cation transporter (cation efflux family)